MPSRHRSRNPNYRIFSFDRKILCGEMLRTNDHCHGGNHMLKCGSQWLYGKRSFSVTTPCARPTRDNTERLAERETLLYRLGSELHRPFSILVEPPLSCSAKTRDLFRSQVFLRTEPFTPKKRPKKEVDCVCVECLIGKQKKPILQGHLAEFRTVQSSFRVRVCVC